MKLKSKINRLTRQQREKLLLIKQEVEERRANDPLYLWEPTPKQVPFIDSIINYLKPENWFCAANRSGKSDAGAYVGSSLARFGDYSPRAADYRSVDGHKSYATTGWVVSRDFPSSRDIIQPKYFDNGFVPPNSTHRPFIPDREIDDWRQKDQILKLKNGSIIGFKSCDSGTIKFAGTEKDWIHFDEEPPINVYEEATLRVGSRPLRIFGTCTILPPEGEIGGVSWVYSEIIQPFLENSLEHLQLFGASIYDNPHLSPSEIAVLESRYPIGSLARRIRLDGEWLPGIGGSRAYGNFDARVHLKPQPPLKLRSPLCWCFDFNVDPFISIVGQYDGATQTFRVYKELVVDDGGKISDMVDLFRHHFPTHSAQLWIFGDATSGKRSQHTGKSDYQLLSNYLSDYPAPVIFKVPDKNPPVPDSINAVNNALVNEFGEIGVLIDPSCKELKADLEQVLRSSDGGIKKTKNRRDPYFRRTHTSDALRYWISYVKPVTSTERRRFRGSSRKPTRNPTYAF